MESIFIVVTLVLVVVVDYVLIISQNESFYTSRGPFLSPTMSSKSVQIVFLREFV